MGLKQFKGAPWKICVLTLTLKHRQDAGPALAVTLGLTGPATLQVVLQE